MGQEQLMNNVLITPKTSLKNTEHYQKQTQIHGASSKKSSDQFRTQRSVSDPSPPLPYCMLRASHRNRCITPLSSAYAGRHPEILWKEPIPAWISGCRLLRDIKTYPSSEKTWQKNRTASDSVDSVDWFSRFSGLVQTSVPITGF